jgi:rRNA maturation endonuclease Nob1
MVYCKECGSEVDGKFCQECGVRVNTVPNVPKEDNESNSG